MLTGALIRAAGENAGNYIISQGTLSAGDNYALVFTPGTLSMAKAALTVTVADLNSVYGNAQPAFQATVTGLKNGDTATALGPISYGTSQNGQSVTAHNAGRYDITAQVAANDNYAVTYQPGIYVITTRPLTVTAPSATITDTDALPALAGSANLIAGDADKVTFTFAPSGYAGQPGTYAIVANANDPGDILANYSRTDVVGTLTVLAARQGPDTVYDASVPARAIGFVAPADILPPVTSQPILITYGNRQMVLEIAPSLETDFPGIMVACSADGGPGLSCRATNTAMNDPAKSPSRQTEAPVGKQQRQASMQ